MLSENKGRHPIHEASETQVSAICWHFHTLSQDNLSSLTRNAYILNYVQIKAQLQLDIRCIELLTKVYHY